MKIVGRSIDEIEVGQTAVFTRSYSEKDVLAFADLSWDHNPYHTHEEFAKRGRFGEPIVHGMLVAAAFTHFGGDFFPGPAILATDVQIKFQKPVYVGETITFTAKVTEVDKEKGWIEYVTTGANENGEQVVEVVCKGMPTAIDVDS
jgi:3-hydroxybutyryl-CoA dehydratase